MAETVSGRLPGDLVGALDSFGRDTGRSRSEVLRLVVERGLREVRLERALEEYRARRASVGRAAEIAGVHLTEMIDALHRAEIPFHYGVRELEEDLAWARGSRDR